MLKIKDSVNIEELERFGFKPKYDEDTGEVIAYQKVNKEIEYEGLTVKVEGIKSKIRIFKRTKKGWLINKYNERFDIDTLYDLIQAGLVEKMEEDS